VQVRVLRKERKEKDKKEKRKKKEKVGPKYPISAPCPCRPASNGDRRLIRLNLARSIAFPSVALLQKPKRSYSSQIHRLPPL
jgi:hypothetical protein